jgi:hypothetical protein
MTSGVGEYVVWHQHDVDPNSSAVPSDEFGELDSHVYTVADDGGPVAEVHIEVEGRFQGAEVFSVVSVRTLGSGAIGAVIERAVSPPLYDEGDRQAEVLNLLSLVGQVRFSDPEQLLGDESRPQTLHA